MKRYVKSSEHLPRDAKWVLDSAKNYSDRLLELRCPPSWHGYNSYAQKLRALNLAPDEYECAIAELSRIFGL